MLNRQLGHGILVRPPTVSRGFLLPIYMRYTVAMGSPDDQTREPKIILGKPLIDHRCSHYNRDNRKDFKMDREMDVRFWKRDTKACAHLVDITSYQFGHTWQSLLTELDAMTTAQRLTRLAAFLEDNSSNLRVVCVDLYIGEMLAARRLRMICNEMLMVAR